VPDFFAGAEYAGLLGGRPAIEKQLVLSDESRLHFTGETKQSKSSGTRTGTGTRALSRIRHPPPRISIQQGNLTPLASSVVQETKIARDFSVVTLETDAFRSEEASNGTKASEPKRWATSPTRSKGPELR